MTYAALSENQILANSLIRRYQELDASEGVAVTVEQAQTELNKLLVMLPSLSNVSQFTLKEFVNLANELSTLTESDSWMSCLKEKVKALQEIDEVTEKVLPDFKKASSQGTDALNIYLKTLLSSIIANPTFVRESIDSPLASALPACVQAQNLAAIQAQRFKKDLQAQKSLILNVLEMYAE